MRCLSAGCNLQVSAHEVFDDEGQSDDHPDEGRAAQTEPEEPPSAKSIYPCSSARASSGGEEVSSQEKAVQGPRR